MLTCLKMCGAISHPTLAQHLIGKSILRLMQSAQGYPAPVLVRHLKLSISQVVSLTHQRKKPLTLSRMKQTTSFIAVSTIPQLQCLRSDLLPLKAQNSALALDLEWLQHLPLLPVWFNQETTSLPHLQCLVHVMLSSPKYSLNGVSPLNL